MKRTCSILSMLLLSTGVFAAAHKPVPPSSTHAAPPAATACPPKGATAVPPPAVKPRNPDERVIPEAPMQPKPPTEQAPPPDC